MNLPQSLDIALTDFAQAPTVNDTDGLKLSASALATLALYRYIRVLAQKKRQGRMLMAPIFRLLANASGTARKQDLPVDA